MPRAMRRERGKTRVVHISARSLDVNVDAAERAGERANERASERAATAAAAANVSTASQRIRVFATRADLTVVR